MASTLKALNSIGGFSIGDDPQIAIIQANGDITGSNITANGSLVANATSIYGNLNISNANATWGLLTDNLYYSNGSPWVMSNPAGANGYIQYYDDGEFGASANFQFTSGTNTLQVTGLANITGNLNVSSYINGNIGNFSGNINALNANLGTGLLLAGNANIATTLNGNIANFSGNLTSLNANLGNLATANFANISSNLLVSGNANIGANLGVVGTVLANNITSNNRVSATNLKIGNSFIYANTVTTTSTMAAEIASFMITNTDVYGIEYIVKSYDGTGSKYSMATVQAVTDGTDVNYVTYATVRLGNTTGALSVTRTAVGLDVSINLIATPSSGNSTIWTTQYRLI